MIDEKAVAPGKAYKEAVDSARKAYKKEDI
jgi:hypothetical protein